MFLKKLPVIYKHENTLHIRSLHERDSIRVGTLYDFRNQEHGKGIADELEGTKTLSTTVTEKLPLTENDLRGTLPELLGAVHVSGGATITMNNVSMETSFNAPDCHILCFSASNTEAARKSANRDATMFVIDPFWLIHRIARFLTELYGCEFRFIANYCHYIPRIQEMSWRSTDLGIDPLFIKGEDAHYVDQAEFRMAFLPSSKIKLEPLITCIPGISSVFSIPNELVNKS